MAFLVTTIIVEVADEKATLLDGHLRTITEETIRNSLFGEGYMPPDVEVESWAVSTKWIDASTGQPFVLHLPHFDGEVLKKVNNDTLDYLCGGGELEDDEDDALRRIVDAIKES